MRPVLAAILALLAPLALAGAAVAAPTKAAAVSQEALELARLMSPRDLLVKAELQQFDLNFRKTLLQDEDVKALEAEFPGVTGAMAKSVRPMLADYTGSRVDALHPLVARLLQDELTPEDIDQLTAFYASSTGRAVLKQMIAAVDASDAYRSALDGEGQISEDVAEAQSWIAGFKAVGSMSKSEHDALLAFGEQPVAAKLNALSPKLRALTLDTMSAADPDFDKRLEQVMTEAIEAHIGSSAGD